MRLSLSSPDKSKLSHCVQHGTVLRLRRLLIALSITLFLVVALCYWVRPDDYAAVTVFPAWLWLVPGFFFAAVGYSRRSRRASLGAATLWLLFLVIFVEETRSLFRLLRREQWPAREWKLAHQQGRAVRVVSINCSGGDPQAAAEVLPYQPDVVLLQESPSRQDVEKLARQLFGQEAGMLWGVDASVLARGHITTVKLPAQHSVYFVQARVALASGITMDAISCRLMTPPFRLDLWSPACWQAYRANRQFQHAQMSGIAQQIAALPRDVPIVAGGDWNAPAGDAVFRTLRPRLHDTFSEAGQGWGNTITNEFPVLRIDQIWASSQWRTSTVVARKTQHSDHRMVICDLQLAAP